MIKFLTVIGTVLTVSNGTPTAAQTNYNVPVEFFSHQVGKTAVGVPNYGSAIQIILDNLNSYQTTKCRLEFESNLYSLIWEKRRTLKIETDYRVGFDKSRCSSPMLSPASDSGLYSQETRFYYIKLYPLIITPSGREF